MRWRKFDSNEDSYQPVKSKKEEERLLRKMEQQIKKEERRKNRNEEQPETENEQTRADKIRNRGKIMLVRVQKDIRETAEQTPKFLRKTSRKYAKRFQRSQHRQRIPSRPYVTSLTSRATEVITPTMQREFFGKPPVPDFTQNNNNVKRRLI